MLIQLILNGLAAGAAAALLAGGFSLLYSASRFFIFTYGTSYTVAAYTILSLIPGIGFRPAAAAGVATATGLAVALEKGIYAPIRDAGDRPLVLMLASIGLYTIIQNVVSLAFGDATRSATGRL